MIGFHEQEDLLLAAVRRVDVDKDVLSVLRSAEEFIAEHLVFSAGRDDAELSRLGGQAGTDAPAGLSF